MIGHILRHVEKLHSLIIQDIIEGIRPRGIPRTKYISQIIKDAGVTFYRELKCMVNYSEKWRQQLLL